MVHRSLAVAGAIALAGALLAGCGSTTTAPPVDTGGRSAYAGSATCQPCHAEQYQEAQEQSGHPYKLVKVENGQQPNWPANVRRGPYQASPTPPAGVSWADVSYVIGGYGWKTRYIDLDGYIHTGSAVQWNIRNSTWSGYEPNTPNHTKPYDYACFQCHTTGAQDGTDDLSTHQDGLAGMKGTFAEPGIRCESCHGPGAAHAARPAKENIVLNAGTAPAGQSPTSRLMADDNENLPGLYFGPGRSASRQANTLRAMTCGECHTRKGPGNIASAGGFIQHHEQFDELQAAGPHSLIDCATCHDPHRGTVYNDNGINRDCQSCHGSHPTSHVPGPGCVDCHMPNAAKSATAANAYKADVPSHIYRIRTTTETKTAFFSADGTKVALDSGGKAALTLDFACYGCHKDGNGAGGGASAKTMDELAAKAATIHD